MLYWPIERMYEYVEAGHDEAEACVVRPVDFSVDQTWGERQAAVVPTVVERIVGPIRGRHHHSHELTHHTEYAQQRAQNTQLQAVEGHIRTNKKVYGSCTIECWFKELGMEPKAQ